MKAWLKILGWLLAIADLVLGIYVGDSVGRHDFEWIYAIGIWIIGILTLTACFYLAGVIERQEDIRDLLVYIATDNKDNDKFSAETKKTVELRVQEIFSKVTYNTDDSENSGT